MSKVTLNAEDLLRRLDSAIKHIETLEAENQKLGEGQIELAGKLCAEEAEVTRLRNLLAAASLALYQTHPETWQDKVEASLSKTFMKAHAGLDALEQKQAQEIIERIEKEKA